MRARPFLIGSNFIATRKGVHIAQNIGESESEKHKNVLEYFRLFTHVMNLK